MNDNRVSISGLYAHRLIASWLEAGGQLNNLRSVMHFKYWLKSLNAFSKDELDYLFDVAWDFASVQELTSSAMEYQKKHKIMKFKKN